METAVSMEPGEPAGGDVSPCPEQVPESNEGPVSAQLVDAPASTKPADVVDGPALSHAEAVDAPVLPPAVQIPTAATPIEAVEDYIRPSPAPMSKGPIEEIECRVWPRPAWAPAPVSSNGLPEGDGLPGPGRRGQAELVMDEQEYWQRQQAAGAAQEVPKLDGAFPAYRGNAINVSRACLIFVILVVIVITCYIIATRLIFLSKWSPAALFDSFYGPTRKTASYGTPQPEVW
ncbi:hypothetical protein HPB50_025073 [Hyalomma asiaticum]|uniref:Uncharacterized protein n=1 Tax=Hyalomma asiaticum TaxID=266040 RepID=A0ACB7TQM6_HYAAI|nr:hypothetical protein HPB50_025073 [Hyalomma asiaticum]